MLAASAPLAAPDPVDISEPETATVTAPKPIHPTATLTLPTKERGVKGVGGVLSDGTLAGSVLELAQTLTKNNAVLRERSEERARLSAIVGDFRKHLSWQAQRTQQLKRNLERLHNETNWLTVKAGEVGQDAHVVNHELRQVTGELNKLKAVRDQRKKELAAHDAELKLERDAARALGDLVTQAHKSLIVHTRERDAWKAEADRAAADARKIKDRLEAIAYKVNGIAAGASL